ncbi:M24 family metallopeptidase, partial [Candidatus Saccharibacteria bacterium]|nr:M24 family metallopeptidase [Candidatus Saccharibacteria bacterium]
MNEKKIRALREGGKILGGIFRDLREQVKPGVTGKELDAWVRAEIGRRGAGVAYDMLPKKEAFPGAICISVNDEIIHGIPKDIPLEEGDKVSFDLDVFYKGYFTDSAFTMIVGGEKAGSPAVRRMISVTEEAMWAGVEQIRAGAHVGDIGFAVERVLKLGRLGVIENYVGHGIGKEMHENPEVPNYGKKGHGYKLK